MIIPLISIFLIGTFGYHFIEGWPLFEGFYMTVITLTTVGYGEVHHLSQAGRIFTVVLLLVGLSNFAYVLRYMSIEILQPIVAGVLEEKKLLKQVRKMNDHYIVCGMGRIGKDVVRNLLQGGKQIVVVDEKPCNTDFFEINKIPYIQGDASHEEILLYAGIERAKGLVACVGSEAENVFITMTARELRKDLYIISRYEEEATQKKLFRAGASRVVNPYHIGGNKIAQLILKPTISKILDVAYGTAGMNLAFEELDILPGHFLEGKTLRNCNIRDEYNIMIIAVEKPDGQVITSLKPEYQFEVGDRVVMFADEKDFQKLC